MAVISFASLKGGVGKTSLSLNVAHAFARQGNRVLLIDSDPAAHASRFFRHPGVDKAIEDSTLGRLFFSLRTRLKDAEEIDLLDAADEFQIPLFFDVRENLSILPGSAQLQHFLWGPGAKLYKFFFPKLISDLSSLFDLIIFDTCPDFNLMTRNIIAASTVVVVPVDASEMSICSMEQIFKSSQHINGPQWAIVRSMISKKASRVNKLSEGRLDLSKELKVRDAADLANLDEEEDDFDEEFVDLVKEVENYSVGDEVTPSEQPADTLAEADKRDIFLLRSKVFRTELQNRLSFIAKTAFDTRETKKLAAEYDAVSRELEAVLSLAEGSAELDASDSLGSLMVSSSSQECGY